MIVNSGIEEVVYEDKYEFSGQTKALLAEAGVKCRQFRRGLDVAMLREDRPRDCGMSPLLDPKFKV